VEHSNAGQNLLPHSSAIYRSSDNRKQLAGYLGLTRAIFRAGRWVAISVSVRLNTKARTTMIELAWMWLKHQTQPFECLVGSTIVLASSRAVSGELRSPQSLASY
jgi:hypothetical protein